MVKRVVGPGRFVGCVVAAGEGFGAILMVFYSYNITRVSAVFVTTYQTPKINH